MRPCPTSLTATDVLAAQLHDARACADVGDQRAIDPKTIDLLLNQERNTTALNAELRHVIHSISSGPECDLDYVASQIQAMGVTADSGLELVAADLDEFLGLSRKRTTHTGPLRPTMVQSRKGQTTIAVARYVATSMNMEMKVKIKNCKRELRQIAVPMIGKTLKIILVTPKQLEKLNAIPVGKEVFGSAWEG
jgi:hypothetical protein